jgi:hypothetical protein
MADYSNTGYQRAKTLNIEKRVGGVMAVGYPKSFSILNPFTVSGVSYGLLREDSTYKEFSRLSLAQYNARLAAFKLYVEQAEIGLNVDAVTVSGHEAYTLNLDNCPLDMP